MLRWVWGNPYQNFSKMPDALKTDREASRRERTDRCCLDANVSYRFESSQSITGGLRRRDCDADAIGSGRLLTELQHTASYT